MTFTWRNLPNPRDESCPSGTRCDVHLEVDRWSHFQPHHDDPAEPWGDWLPGTLAQELRDSCLAACPDARRQAVRQRVSDQMEAAARQSLGVPLAVLYDVAQPPKQGVRGSPWEPTADIVLACGAKLCVRQREGNQFSVRTCFFPDEVRSKPAPRRWRWLVRSLIKRYATDNGNDTFSPPSPSAWPQPGSKGEMVNDPRFRTNARWGLDRPLAEPWFAIPDPWPTLPAPPPALGLRRRPAY